MLKISNNTQYCKDIFQYNGWKLRTHLLILVVIIFIPILGLLILRGYDDRKQSLEKIKEQSEQMFRLFVDEQVCMIDSTRQLLEILSHIPAVHNLELDECNSILTTVKSHSPQYSTFVAADKNGVINCCAVPIKQPIDVKDRSWFKRIVETRQFVVDDFLISRSAHKASLPFAYPVLDDSGNLKAAVGAAFDLSYYSHIFNRILLPPESVIIITDKKEDILHISGLSKEIKTSELLGQPLAKIRGFRVPAQSKGNFTVTDSDNIERIYWFEHLSVGQSSNNICLFVGFSKKVIFNEANRLMLRNIFLLALFAILSFGFTWFFCEKSIVKPVNLLVRRIRTLHFKRVPDMEIGISKTLYPTQELELLSTVFEELVDKLTQREKELHKARQDWEDIFNAIGQPAVILDPAHHIINANDKIVLTSGISKDEIVGQKCYKLFHSSNFIAPADGCPMRNILISKSIETVEMEMEALNGTYLVSCTPIFNEQGAIEKIIHIAADITKQKRTEESLRLNRERLESVIKGGELGYWDWDITTGKVERNARWAEMLGYTLPEIELNVKQWTDLHHPDDREAAWKSINDHLEGKSDMHKLEYRMLCKDGNYKWILDCAKIVKRDDQDRPLRMSGTHTDITERKQAEEEIKKFNKELEERVAIRTFELDKKNQELQISNRNLEAANQELESFSYSVSHDLKAPLRGIDGWTLALYEDYYDILDEQGRQYIERVRGQTKRMGELIEDILKLSRISRSEINLQTVNLSESAYKVIDSIKNRYIENDRYIESKTRFIIEPDLEAYVDQSMIEIVITNLIENAFKFTRKTEKPIIEFGKLTSESNRFKSEGFLANQQLDQLNTLCYETFYVKDNGAGFDMRYSEKLFTPFQRLHKSSDFEGTGIGLATVKRIIHRHEGAVWAEGYVDKGALFYFTLKKVTINI